jgi:prepilin-type N-terminal cleavage/methylation domain-containing protein/prepilin-type processing-associated H-X9-DG protein
MASPPQLKGFTLVELLVVIAIIAILASLALPISRSITENGNAAKCLGNMRNIGLAAMAYASENNMKLPMTSHKGAENQWEVTLQPYSGNAIDFKCPSDPDKTRTRSYAINDMLTPNPCQAEFLDFSYLSKIDRPAETIYFAEAQQAFTMDHFHFSQFYGDQLPGDVFEELVDVHRHGGRANYLFADCHAEMLSWDAVKNRLANTADRLTDPTR